MYDTKFMHCGTFQIGRCLVAYRGQLVPREWPCHRNVKSGDARLALGIRQLECDEQVGGAGRVKKQELRSTARNVPSTEMSNEA